MAQLTIKPQKGFQEKVFGCQADIAIIGGSAGGGKAQPYFCKVLTPNGFIEIGSLKEGDYVLTPTGEATKVLRTYLQGSIKTYKITFSDGRSTFCCEDHLWKVWSKYKWKIVDTKWLIERKKSFEGDRLAIPLVSNYIQESATRNLPIHPYLIGVIIGDGNICTTRNNNSVKITSADEEIIERFHNLLPSDYKLSRRSKYDYDIVFVEPRAKISFQTICDNLGLRNKSNDKSIPESYLNLPYHQKIELIKGLMDSDGTVSKTGSPSFCTTSYKLAEQVRKLIISIGGICHITKKTPKFTYKGEYKDGLLAYKVCIRIASARQLFSLSRKLNLLPEVYQYEDLKLKIDKIEYIGYENSLCIYIEDEEHLYVTDDYIVTHNTMALIVEPLKWIHIPEFAAVFFRRDKERIRATGGLLAESKKWYLEGVLSETILKWKFPSGAQVDFEGIEYTKDLDKWLGTQIPLIVFDEVTEFEEQMFWFMVSRNRGIVTWTENGKKYALKPYVRASCNPLPNSWVSRLLEWWIDQETGYPIDERDGIIRYFIRWKDKIYWGDTKDEVVLSCPEAINSMFRLDPSIKPHDLIKSFTFIRGKLSDNKILTKNSPEYYSSLLSMSEENQQRFLEGNWKISSDGTDLFEFPKLREMFVIGEFNDNIAWEDTYITCDAAKFGQDLCTIYVWRNWVVIAISIFYISDTKDTFEEIEFLKTKYAVRRDRVMIDQDGLGGDLVKMGKYQGFGARKKAEKQDGIQENYNTFKDQCYFHAAEKVNSGDVKFLLSSSNVRIFDRGSSKPRQSMKMKWKGDLVPLQPIIIEQMSAIRKGETVLDGGERKYGINSKEAQKEILGGISPDLADPVCIRAAFDLEKKRKGIAKLR